MLHFVILTSCQNFPVLGNELQYGNKHEVIMFFLLFFFIILAHYGCQVANIKKSEKLKQLALRKTPFDRYSMTRCRVQKI